MITVLENRRYRAEISSRGAELQDLLDRPAARPLLWQGDPACWPGRSPLLFPLVGRLREDRYLVGDQSYSMPKHGFAQNAEFAAERLSSCRARFTLTDTPQSRRMYPFPFRLTLTYTLRSGGLTLAYEVANPGDGALPFSLGAHPGLNCSAGDWLLLSAQETALAHRLDAQKLLTPADTPVLDATRRRVPLTDTLFDRGALILENPKSRAVTLVRPGAGYLVKLAFSAPPPCLGLWAFPKAPYVCVEPWHGLDDTPGPVRALREKPYLLTLAPGHRFRWAMTLASAPYEGQP